MTHKLDISARLTFNKIQFDKNNNAHLVVTLKAPKIDWQAKRPAICIIPIVDVSGSMMGEKLEYAKQSVMKLVDHLQPGDFCGLVTFESSVQTVSAPMEMTQANKDALKLKIGQLVPMGSTNLSGGMVEGLTHLMKADLPTDILRRAILFTDGQPNAGVASKREDLLTLLGQFIGKASLSAFGFGADACQDLLADLAKAGNGNYAFVQNPENALTAFAKELGGLLSTYAQNFEVVVEPQNGHIIEQTISDIDAKVDGKKVVVKFADILSEEERHLVFKVLLDKQSKAFPRASTVFDVSTSFDLLKDGKKVRCTEENKVKVQFVKEADADKTPDKAVDAIVGVQQLVQAQLEAERLANNGNFVGAAGVMAASSADFGVRGLSSLVGTASKMSTMVGSAGTYASSTSYRSSSKSFGTRGMGTSAGDDEAAADYAAAGVALNNSAQDDVIRSFTGTGAGVTGQAGTGGGVFAQGTPPAHQPGVVGLTVGGNSANPSGWAAPLPQTFFAPAVVTVTPFPAPVPPPVAPPAPVVPTPSASKSRSKRW